jgi:hypothetical protein
LSVVWLAFIRERWLSLEGIYILPYIVNTTQNAFAQKAATSCFFLFGMMLAAVLFVCLAVFIRLFSNALFYHYQCVLFFRCFLSPLIFRLTVLKLIFKCALISLAVILLSCLIKENTVSFTVSICDFTVSERICNSRFLRK